MDLSLQYPQMPFSYAITIGCAHRHDSILAPYNSSINVNHISSNNIRAEVLKATASKHSLPRIRIPSERVRNSSAHVRLSCGTRGIGAGEARPSLASGNGVTGCRKTEGKAQGQGRRRAGPEPTRGSRRQTYSPWRGAWTATRAARLWRATSAGPCFVNLSFHKTASVRFTRQREDSSRTSVALAPILSSPTTPRA